MLMKFAELYSHHRKRRLPDLIAAKNPFDESLCINVPFSAELCSVGAHYFGFDNDNEFNYRRTSQAMSISVTLEGSHEKSI